MDTELTLKAIAAAREAEAHRLVRARTAREDAPIGRPARRFAALRSLFGLRRARVTRDSADAGTITLPG